MKIATFNVKNKTASKILRLKPSALERFRLNVDLIKKSDSDIIGLQEVTADEYQLLKQEFGNTYDFYGDFRKSPVFTNEACPIMVKKGLGTVTNSQTFSISNDINKIGKKYFGALFPRISTFIYFNHEKDMYVIGNMHIDNSKIIQTKTFAQNGPIQKILDKCVKKESNIILMGDMNSELSGSLYDFSYRNSLIDALEPLGKTYKPLNLSIDHILYKDDLMTSMDAKTFTNKGSDHSLIMVNINKRRG